MDTFTRREIFTTPRFLDFVGEEELTKQIGHPSRMWALVAIKELIDNAIDHAEEEGLPPQVEVEVTRRTITVADHGRGIPDEAIDGALDFAVRASSREAFVGPTRARDHIQRRSGKTLDSNYFSQTLLIDFVEANAELTKSWKIAWDARGNLILPHSHRRVPLSTLDVEAYIATKGWRDHYGAALFVEKEGFNPLFEEVQLGDRYDMAIMSTKGMSVTAARTLIDALVADGVRVFALRDFDVSGFTIAGTLGRNTRRHTRQTAGAVDLGLRLEDVEVHDLAKEAVQHKRGKVLLTSRAAILAFIGPNLRRNGATEEEIEFLIRHRVELNAFTSGELVRCVEAKLDAAGVVKVTPREETLAAEAHEHAESIAEKQILAPLFAQLRAKHAAELEALTARLMAKPFKPAVAEFLERHRTADWRAALAHVVQGRA